MQGLILAAGMGKRLKQYTDRKPKVLIEVHEICLLTNALEQLIKQGVKETIIVVGYKKEMIIEKYGFEYKNMKIIYVENCLYEHTNNIYSFYLAQEYINDDILMLEGDLLYQEEVLKQLNHSEAECSILVSKYNQKTMNGTVIMADQNGNAKSLVLKDMQGAEFDYTNAWKTVNIYKMKKHFIKDHLFPAVKFYIETEDKNSYYEKVLGSIIYYNTHDIKIVKIDEKDWFEIDDETDLKYAIENFNEIE